MESRAAEATAKFKAYHEKLDRCARTGEYGGSKRAGYEGAWMKQSRFVEINGVVHHYIDSGPRDAEETIVLIHGWDCWWMWWHHIMRNLNEKGVRTIAYDLKGHGWSDNDAGNNYTIPSYAEDLNVLVETLGLEKFHIAAFSFGPLVTLNYAVKYPGKLRSMVFFNFGYLPNSQVVEQVAPAIINFAFNNMLRKVTSWLPAYMFARLVLARNTVMTSDVLIGFESLGQCASDAIEQTTRQITSLEVTEGLPGLVGKIDIPVLFAAGEGDPIMTCESAEKLERFATKGSYVCVPQCGHLITLELPETATDIIYRHVAAHA